MFPNVIPPSTEYTYELGGGDPPFEVNDTDVEVPSTDKEVIVGGPPIVIILDGNEFPTEFCDLIVMGMGTPSMVPSMVIVFAAVVALTAL